MAANYYLRPKHSKKLSANIDAQQYQDLIEKPGHKRVKSDALDKTRIQMDAEFSGHFQPPSASLPPSAGPHSLRSMAKKETQPKSSSDYYEQKRYGQQGEPEKLVNVSIDDINQSEDLVSTPGDNWLRVPAEEMQQKNWQHGVINKFH